ncbi:GNAT family N-acetyltransferase [Streptomyces rubiginosohelvolus]|uniref:GNAT family N-acetyltransferase n=1 Tax=Streptomyces rubiginosohelvolus TaxID=67362 RepID=UPI003870CA76|nr:GNAT family N-acetyltransferase [Streptomyces rubiginosohelvolus]
MTTDTTLPSITIRPVQADELDTFFDLTLLVDLHVPTDELPALKDNLATALRAESGPFSHGLNHFLIAETGNGTPVAAVHAGPPRWMNKPQIRRARKTLSQRVSNIDTIAVHPQHRNQGIATHLLARVESDFRRAGYRALTLLHEHDKRRFFTTHGFTTFPRLVLDLPAIGLFSQHDPGWKHAVKPLDPTVTFTSQRGLTAVSGLLD